MHSMKKMKTMRIQYPDPVAQGKSMINMLYIYILNLTINDKAKDKKADKITSGNAAATATSSDLSTATTFTADLTTAITTASTIIFTATDHTSSTHCKKHNKSPSLCTSSGCQEVLETRRPRTGMHSMKKMKTMRI